MLVRDILTISWRALRSHKLRSGLTMLGLIIGVAAVILLSAFGQGIGDSVTSAVKPVANAVTIVPKLSPIPGGPNAEPMTDADAREVSKIPGIAAMVPYVNGSTTNAAGQQSTAVVAAVPGAQYLSSVVYGTTANYLEAVQHKLSAGTFFTAAQVESKARVAVLGPLVSTALFGPDPHNALGRTVRLNHRPFQVIGVVQPYGESQDNGITVPEGAARAGIFGYGYGGNQISGIYLLTDTTAQVPEVEAQVTTILRASHRIINPRFDDFQVQDLGSRVSTFTNLIKLITGFVPAIAAISLVVGGIGVLNIMLVSVTDRTREIGTRKAIGASDTAILLQFVLEAMALAGLGGLVGVLLATGATAASKFLLAGLGSSGVLAGFSPALSAAPILISFVASLLIGLVAGGYPAWRAASLRPIEALRYE